MLSEHKLFTLKGKELEIYLYCTVRAWIILTLCPFLTVPRRVGLQSVIVGISWPYSIIFGTIIIVDDITIVVHKIGL